MLGTWPKPLTPLRWLCRPPPFPLDDPVSDARRPCTRPRLRGFAHDHNAGPRRRVTAHGHRAGPRCRVTAHGHCAGPRHTTTMQAHGAGSPRMATVHTTAHGHRAGPQRRVTAHATCTATAHGHGAVTRTASERACVPFARHAKPLLKS